jgi:hypothetical protein
MFVVWSPETNASSRILLDQLSVILMSCSNQKSWNEMGAAGRKEQRRKPFAMNRLAARSSATRSSTRQWLLNQASDFLRVTFSEDTRVESSSDPIPSSMYNPTIPVTWGCGLETAHLHTWLQPTVEKQQIKA